MASPVVPKRHASVASALSDDAVPDQDPSETSKLLTERLRALKHACGYLENYVSATEKLHKAQSKEYEKVLKSVSDPLKEAHHFDQNVGGIAGLFENIRSNTQGIANSHSETEKNLKGSVLPILERLHTEIKNKSKELASGAAKGSKAVDKARNATQKHIDLLSQNAAGFNSSGGKADPLNDPYVLQRGVYHRLNKQVLEENNNRQDLLAVQNNFAQFEAHVVQTIQQAMGSFLQFVGGQADRTKGMYTDMVETSQAIPLDFEWQRFVSRNNEILIDPRAPPRSMSNVTFPNQNHRSTKPLIEGSLERKGKLLKSYSTGYYIVTPSKFLHEYKTDDDFQKDPTPEWSLYLPDSIVGAVDGSKFNVKGKDSSKGKVGNAFSMTHELAFKAHTPADAQKWWNIISAASGSTLHELPEPGSNSPVSPRQTSDWQQQQPPSYTENSVHPAPVQTTNLQHGTTYTSPQSAGSSGTQRTPTSAGGHNSPRGGFGGAESTGASPTAGTASHSLTGQGIAAHDATGYGAQVTGSGIERAPGQY
ncbi:MAG: hypothetical protein M1819_001804 [Sarea resinae]|nr:MAG: hypothetical protein M1819_001804 [Sarea resinae]